MRKTLDRYLITECLPTLGLSIVISTFVLLMHRLFKLSDMVVAKGVPIDEVLGLLGLALPALVPLLVPFALLLAVLLAVGRLSADSEIVAMRASGVGFGQNLRPIMGLSFAVFAACAAVSLWLQPLAARSFKQAVYDSVKNRIDLATEMGAFNEIMPGITLYADRVDRETGVMENLFLELDREGLPSVWILAAAGSIREEPGTLALDLEHGEMHQHEQAGSPYRRLRFEQYTLRIDLPGTAWTASAEESPTRDLVRSAFSLERDREARLELHRRLALPASCLVFGLLGAALGLHHSRGGRSRGVGLCLGVLLVYYALFTTAKALGKRGGLPPEAAMWTPNLVLGALGIYAFFRKNREAPLPVEESLGRWLGRLRSRSRDAKSDP